MSRLGSRLVFCEIVIEALTAVALVLVPTTMIRLLFGPQRSDTVVVMVCIAGIALILFVFGCWLGLRRGAWCEVAPNRDPPYTHH